MGRCWSRMMKRERSTGSVTSSLSAVGDFETRSGSRETCAEGRKGRKTHVFRYDDSQRARLGRGEASPQRAGNPELGTSALSRFLSGKSAVELPPLHLRKRG